MEIEQKVQDFIDNNVYPQTLYDGGYIKFESMSNNNVILGAYHECAACLGCKERLKEWICAELKKLFGIDVKISYKIYKPYFK